MPGASNARKGLKAGPRQLLPARKCGPYDPEAKRLDRFCPTANNCKEHMTQFAKDIPNELFTQLLFFEPRPLWKRHWAGLSALSWCQNNSVCTGCFPTRLVANM